MNLDKSASRQESVLSEAADRSVRDGARNFSRLYAPIDYFLPAYDLRDVQQVERRRRAQILVTFCLLAGTTSICVPLVLAVFTGDLNVARIAIMSVGALLLLNPILLKLSGRFEPVAYLFYVESGLLMAGQTAFLGGILAPTLVNFLLWPIGAFFIVGRALGAMTTGLVILFLSVMWANPMTFAAWNFYPSSSDNAAVLFVCFCGVLVFSAIVSWTYETFQANFRTRTVELLEQLRGSQAALIEAKHAAETANRAKSAFLANMSHEIRTPMNGVLGMTELMESSKLDSDQQEMVHTIKTSSEALLNILNDILDLSKVEAGKLTLETKRFNLRATLEESLDLVAPGAAAKGLELLLDYPDAMPERVWGDEFRLRQIITNLLSNALKFTEQGEIKISVHQSSSNNRFDIAVADTGMGISKEQQSRLFTAFQQADEKIASRFGGTGLGLSISRQLTQLMGGDLRLESQPGVGSTFLCSIELEIDHTQPKLQHLPNADNACVLLMVQNESLADILTQRLTHWGLRTFSAASLAAADTVLNSGAVVDLVLLDENLAQHETSPSPHGAALPKSLQRLPLVWLACSSTSTPPPSTNALVVQKPLRNAVLRDALSNALGGETNKTKATTSPARASESLAVRRPLRILVADDNRTNRIVAERMLLRLGYQPKVVEHGQAAVDACTNEPFDLILMDIEMPWLSGLEATQKIRDIYQNTKQPIIIALTANAMTGDRERYLAAGMDDYLSKPLRVKALEAMLEGHAQTHSA